VTAPGPSGREFRFRRRAADRFASLHKSPTGDPRVSLVHGPLRVSGVDAVQSIVVQLVGSVDQAKQLAESFWEFAPMAANESDIIESVRMDKSQVDAAAGLIRNVKVVGFKSANNDGKREYAPAGLRKAAPLYEGIQVNIDHDRKGTERRVADRFGKLEQIKFVESDGLRGDLRYNVKHPLAGQVAWFAENMPEALGFSHHTRGSCRMQGGVEIVEEIKAVRCVDIVADPATTRSLFESEGGLSESVQAVLADSALDTVAKVRRITELLEGSETPIHTPPPRKTMTITKEDITLELVEARPDILAAINAKGETATKIKELTEANATLQKKLDEQAAATALATRKAANEKLLTEAKLPPQLITPLFKKQVEEAADDATAKLLIEDRKALAGAVNRPRAADQNAVSQHETTSIPTDLKALAAGFKGR